MPVGASLEEIRQAYRRLVQEHLDDEAAFADLKEAYEVLSTPTRRAEYDETVWGGTFEASSAPVLSALKAGRCPMAIEAQCPVLQDRTTPADIYCPDCGYALAGLTSGTAFEAVPNTVKGPWLEGQAGEEYPLRLGSNSVGRDSSDVLAADKTISRLHARLDLSEDGSLIVEDLGSTNGTRVNEVALVPNAPRSLTDGDRLRFGSVSMTLHLPGAAAPTAPAAEVKMPAEEAPAGAQAVRARMVGIGDGDTRVFLLSPGMTTFGRRPENTVVLSGDLYVSGSHAQVSAAEDAFVLTDIGSTNGTLLNGERLNIHAPVQLSDGDEISIGGTALRFERLGPSAALPETEPEETEPEETEPEEAPKMTVPAEAGAEDAPAEFPEQDVSEHAEG